VAPPTDWTAKALEGERKSRFIAWRDLLATFFLAQGANQVLTLATGILLVRVLAMETFALYALAASVLTFFVSTTDLGITGSLVHFTHAARKEQTDVRPVMAAVWSLRRAIFILGTPIAAVVFLAISVNRGFSVWALALCLIGILGAVWFQMGASFRLQILRLAGRQTASYGAEVGGNGVRFLLLGVFATCGGLATKIGAALAVLASAAGAAFTVTAARPEVLASLRSQKPYLREARSRVLRYLLPTLPSGVYFSLQGPVVTWLAATFGGTSTIASIGALGRLGQIVSLLAPLPGILFLPRLAVITEERLYWRRAAQFAAFFAALLLPIWLISWLFPQMLLWILGTKYAHLQRELPLAIAGAAIAVFGGFGVGLTRARGWTFLDTPALAVLLLAQIAAATVFRLDSVSGLLYFNLVTVLVGLLSQVTILWLGISGRSWVGAGHGR
jgi:O-antigen/teichoic acid export membrane protein